MHQASRAFSHRAVMHVFCFTLVRNYPLALSRVIEYNVENRASVDRNPLLLKREIRQQGIGW